MQQWLAAHCHLRVYACLEATGTYSDGIAAFLQAQGHQVSVVDPLRVAAFRHSEGIRTKTDRQDALVSARFCQQKRPPIWQPPKASGKCCARSRALACWLPRARLGVQVSRFAEADQLVAYTGIATSETRSGTSVHGKPKMSRKGDPRLRKWLYLCALTAMTRDPDFKRWAADY